MTAPWAPFVSGLPRQEIRDELDKIRNPFEIAFYGSKNSFNFSASLRTGHSFLCSGYHKIEIEQSYDKAAMTAKRFDNHLVHVWKDIKSFIEGTKGRNIVSFEKDTALKTEDLRDFVWPENPIMLFGSEYEGVPDELLEISTKIVHIPLNGLVNSLNVANACSIGVWDLYFKSKWI